MAVTTKLETAAWMSESWIRRSLVVGPGLGFEQLAFGPQREHRNHADDRREDDQDDRQRPTAGLLGLRRPWRLRRARARSTLPRNGLTRTAALDEKIRRRKTTRRRITRRYCEAELPSRSMGLVEVVVMILLAIAAVWVIRAVIRSGMKRY